MSDADAEPSIIPLDIVQGIFEYLFREYVESGRIEVGSRSPEEIFADFKEFSREITVSRPLKEAIDYRGTLLGEARKSAQDGHYELAVTLYAIWAEHFVNGILVRGFERLGHGEEISVPLIKELRLPTKASALWMMVGLPVLNPESLKLMNRIIEFRNMFVHYKWQARDEQMIAQQHEQLKNVVQESEQLVSELFTIESTAFWGGRDRELIGYLHQDITRLWEEKPFTLSFPVQDTEDE